MELASITTKLSWTLNNTKLVPAACQFRARVFFVLRVAQA